jgi:hypothetical protein
MAVVHTAEPGQATPRKGLWVRRATLGQVLYSRLCDAAVPYFPAREEGFLSGFADVLF